MINIKDVIQLVREQIGKISPEINTKLNYLIKKKKLPNLNNPTTFDEKITWLKLYDYPTNKLVSKCSDKYLVRNYITDQGHEEVLNELYGVWDDPHDIDFTSLPSEFVIKWNNDYNSTFIINDRNKDSLQNVINRLSKKKTEKFYLRASEMHYKNIKPKVIVEKLLKEPGVESLTDYKLYCYHGVVKYIMVCVNRDSTPKFYFYDLNWNLQRINNDGKNAPQNFKMPKPLGLNKMIKTAEDLSKPFKFVRADFYLIEGRVYFGELTFTPASGMDANLNRSLDFLLGKDIILEGVLHEKGK